MANSRMRDIYDLRFLAATFDFDGPDLARAVETTFARRRTPLPTVAPTALTDAFAGDATKQTQWRAFLRRSRLELENLDLDEVVDGLREFVLPPLHALVDGEGFDRTWPAGGPWRPATGGEA
jgi:hypothetical protein